MRRLYLFLIGFVCALFQAQNTPYWLIDTANNQIKKVKDSTSAVKFLDSLATSSYFFTQLKEVKKRNDRTEIYYDKGQNFNQAHIQLSDSLSQALKLKNQFYTKNLDSLKQVINKKLSEQGYTFNRVKTKYQGIDKDIPKIELSVVLHQQRRINSFVLKGYDKAPKRFVKNLEKEYLHQPYNDKVLLSIHQSLANHSFVSLEQSPQTLFTPDSTSIYLFLKRKKTNTFDGVIGFGNDKTKKFTFNGTLNLALRNMFNGFESIQLYWQRNPDKGQTFDLKIDVPYMFGSNVGFHTNMNIFRQDSTFANVKLLPSVYLNLNNRQKLGVRGTFETSTVMDSLYTSGKDYTRNGIGAYYDYTEPTDIELFQYKTRIRGEVDFLTTNYTVEQTKAHQTRFFALAERNFHIRGNHYFNLKGEAAMLNSKDEFSTNELLRFGGWNSMRGFNEESLYADFYYYANAEYRYLVGQQAFFDIFAQYGQLNNKILNVKPKLYSIGLGFNFFLPIGLMTFQISNGNDFTNPFKFSDTKIHWGLLSRF